MFINILGVTFTYLGSSLIIFLLASRLMRIEEQGAERLFCLTLGLGPITISWLLTRFLSIFPGHSDLFYIALTGFCFVPPLLLGLNKLHLLRYLLRKTFTLLSSFQLSRRWPETVILLIVFILMSMIVFQTTMLPLTANDPLQYATVSQMIYEYKATDIYPLTTPEPKTGYYAASAHPLGYISLMVWSYMLQGSSQYAGMIKIISPIYVFYTLLLLWHVLSRLGNVYGIFGMFLLITTPIYFKQSAVCHIDPIRVYTFFLAFIWLFEVIRNHGIWRQVLAGFAVGMSMYSHSIGLLTLPIFVFTYYVISNEKHSKRFLSLMVIVSIALLFGGTRYISNYQTFGSPMNDELEVYQLKELGHKEYVRLDREISSTTDRIIFGAFKGFTKPINFGLSYWFFALALMFYFRIIRTDIVCSILLWVVILFYAVVLLSSMLGVDTFIKNDRYFMTIQPFIAYIGAIFLGTFYEKMVNN